MPVLPLFDVSTRQGRLLTRASVNAAMTWPDSTPRQAAYLYWVCAEGLEGLKDKLSEDPLIRLVGAITEVDGSVDADLPTVLNSMIEQKFMPPRLGREAFLSTNLEKFRNEPRASRVKWNTVGAIVSYLHRTHTHRFSEMGRGGASTEKAIEWVVSQKESFDLEGGEAKNYPLLTSQTKIRKWWKHFRPVAHLCFAELWFTQGSLEELGLDNLSEKGIQLAWLAVAKQMENFLTECGPFISFNTLKTGRRYVEQDKISRINYNPPPGAIPPYVEPPFSEDDLV